MAASGFAGLGCQIVWTQQIGVWLGHESAAVLAVVAAFFGGLALGALVLGARIARSARPARWYAACEAAIGLWGLLLVALMAPVSARLLGWTGPQPAPAWQWCVAFAGTFALLLPATAAMGATLPAMERLLARPLHAGPVAALYAANTLGAVLGVLATALWLVPQWGLLRSAAFCAALNLGCALASFRLAAAPSPAAVTPRRLPLALAASLAATGLLGIGYEVLVIRVLSQVAENTVFTFAILLAVYLLGAGLGATAHERWSASRPDCRDAQRSRLLAGLAAACLLGTASLWGAEHAKVAVQQALGGGMAAALAAEAALALAAFGAPTVVMGALFSHLATEARAQGAGLGAAVGANTLGAALAPPVFGVWLLPALGPKAALLLVTAAYLVLAGWAALAAPVAWRSKRAWAIGATGATGAAALAMAAWAPPLAFVSVPEDGRLVRYREGAMAAVSVVEDADGTRRLRIDNRQQEGSSSTRLADGRQAMLPLLLHPAPRRALFLGLGTGITAATAAQQPGVQVDAVELLPEVIDASSQFIDLAGTPRLHVVAADARRFVRAADSPRYDVIVADNFHPARSGSGSLYTVQHFAAVRERLAAGGLFCQWLPLHQLDLATLRSIVRSFLAVHPGGFAMLATLSLHTPVLGLLAREDGGRFDAALLDPRDAPGGDAGGFGIDSGLALLGSFVAGPQALARFAGDAPLNTDDRPVVAYAAPRATYAPDTLPRDRLLAVLHALSLRPDELLQGPPDAASWSRLAAYWRARDRFIEAGRDVRPAAEVVQMLAQVREPLLAVLRISSQFRPASEPLLRMAAALAVSDPAAARALRHDIAEAQAAPR